MLSNILLSSCWLLAIQHTMPLAQKLCTSLVAAFWRSLCPKVRSFPHNSSQFVKVARLQSEFWHERCFRATNFLTKNAPKFCPKCLSLYFVGQKNPAKFPQYFPPNFSAKKTKITDELLQERRENRLSFCFLSILGL